jgi:hypothetical protein
MAAEAMTRKIIFLSSPLKEVPLMSLPLINRNSRDIKETSFRGLERKIIFGSGSPEGSR